MSLRWEIQRDGSSWYAYSGELVIGMVGRRIDTGKIWYSATNAVFMKHIAKGNGEVGSISRAKAAVERAWSAWLALAGLTPATAQRDVSGDVSGDRLRSE